MRGKTQDQSNPVTTRVVKPMLDATTGIQFTKADGLTSILNLDSTNSRVGIGTISPGTVLQINSNSSGAATFPLQVQNNGATASTEVGISFDPTNHAPNVRDAQITAVTNGSNAVTLLFKTGNGAPPTEGMRISPTGNVGIGNTNPTSLFHVGATTYMDSSGNIVAGAGVYITNNGDVILYRPATATLGITGSVRISGNAQVNSTAPVSNSVFTAVAQNGIEFGHTNPAGYRSVLGGISSGNGFLAFHGEQGNANTFTTRGVRSSIIMADTGGGWFFANVASASAANQSFTTQVSIGNGGTIAAQAQGQFNMGLTTTSQVLVGQIGGVLNSGIQLGGDVILQRFAANSLLAPSSIVIPNPSNPLGNLFTPTLRSFDAVTGVVANTATTIATLGTNYISGLALVQWQNNSLGANLGLSLVLFNADFYGTAITKVSELVPSGNPSIVPTYTITGTGSGTTRLLKATTPIGSSNFEFIVTILCHNGNV